MAATFGLVIAVNISDTWLGSGFETECAARGWNIMGMLGSMSLGLGRFVAFLGDEVVDAFVVVHFLDVLLSYFLIKIIYIYQLI
jgi:hypothetical protein